MGGWNVNAWVRRSMAGMLGLALALTWASPAAARSAPGDPDPGFGRRGVVVTDLPTSLPDMLGPVAVQPDGRIVVAGSLLGPSDLFVIRYEADGSLDRSFGGDGMVVTTMPGITSEPADTVIQPDGGILVAGTAYGFTDTGFMVRYHSDGTLDTAFGTEGVARVQFGRQSWVNAVGLQADGRILVTGMGAAFGSPSDLVVGRYMADGTPDASFGAGGTTTLDIGGSEVGEALAVQPDGAIVAAGRTGLWPYGFLVARLLPDGSLDPAFGPGGIVVTPIDTDADAYAVALQSDGSLVVAGRGGGGGIAVARYRTSGALDQSFGAGGIVVSHLLGVAVAFGVAIQTDGRIVVAGRAATPEVGVDVGVVLRFLADGSRDPGFADGGLVHNTKAHPSVFDDLVLQTDGKIVVAGWTEGLDHIACLVQRFLA